MNIAPSPDPNPMAARGETPAGGTSSTENSGAVIFAELLGTPGKAVPDGTPDSAIWQGLPRKQPVDATDPALTMLLPFLLPLAPQALPVPMPQPDAAGVANEFAGGGFAAARQPALDAPTSAQPGVQCSVQPGVQPEASVVPRKGYVVPNGMLPGAANEIVETDSAAVLQSVPDAPANAQSAAMPAVSVVFRKSGPNAEDVAAVFANAIARGDSVVAVTQSGSDAPAPVPAGVMPAVSSSSSQRKNDSVPDIAAALSPEVSTHGAALGAAPATQPATQPAMQPARDGFSGTDVPADFSPPVAQIASSLTQPQTAPIAAEASAQRQTQQISDATSVTEADGTVVAKERRDMTEQFPERLLKPKASAAAAPPAQSDLRVVAAPEKREQPAAPRAIESASAAAVIPFGTQAGRGQSDDAPTAADFKAAAQITQQTLDLAGHVRSTGRESVEVQMRLHDGQEVTVSLRLEHGEWKPVFKTDTEALCRALEQNWHRAVAQPSAQAVKFGTPVFESQRTQGQSDFGRNPDQQSGGRERSSDRRGQNEEPAFPIPAPPRFTPKVMRFSEAAAVQLYA